MWLRVLQQRYENIKDTKYKRKFKNMDLKLISKDRSKRVHMHLLALLPRLLTLSSGHFRASRV